MAARKHRLADELAEDLLCPVCLHQFKEPVILECGHNYCKSCIDEVWKTNATPSCPECREPFQDRRYVLNRLLSKIVDTAQSTQQYEETGTLQEVQKRLCVLESHQCMKHKEALKLFCQEDGCLLCVICVVSSTHRHHTFLPLQEAVSVFQDKLKTTQSTLKSKIKNNKECQSEQEKKISAIQDETQSLEQHIKSRFAKLHKFLEQKEELLIQQLKNEEVVILRKMKENLRKADETNAAIQMQISAIQSKLRQNDPVLFLTGINEEVERFTERQKEVEDSANVKLVCDNLNLGVYKGPLQYSIWKEMLSVISPGLSHLTLDPNTTHPRIILSKDLTTMLYSDVKQQQPPNPERYDVYRCVLGSEGFTSGRHYWEVAVRNKTDWDVGVTKESSQRKGSFPMKPKYGYWRLTLRNGNKYTAEDSPAKVFSFFVKPQKIGVHLDYEGGQVSFYNADYMSHIYTFTHTFTEKLYPYFSPCHSNSGKNVESLKIFHLKL